MSIFSVLPNYNNTCPSKEDELTMRFIMKVNEEQLCAKMWMSLRNIMLIFEKTSHVRAHTV